MTKKMSTPMKPPLNPGTPKWLKTTRIMATALKPAMCFKNPADLKFADADKITTPKSEKPLLKS
jgi:hypothetical protein